MSISHSEIKIRSAIRMGGSDGFYLETPYIKSFNVKRTRGQLSATFSATLKVKRNQLSENKTNQLGNKFEIWAGVINEEQALIQEQRLPTKNGYRYIMSLENNTSANIKKIFTGYVLRINFNPCRDDAEFIFLNVSGNDVFFNLQNKKFTRRSDPKSMEIWGAITSVVRSRGNFDEKFPPKVSKSSDDDLVIGDDYIYGGIYDGVVTTTPDIKLPYSRPIAPDGNGLTGDIVEEEADE